MVEANENNSYNSFSYLDLGEFTVAPTPDTIESLYIIGSLRNPQVPEIGRLIRDLGYEAFDNWHAAGPEADDYWQKYETSRGHSYKQALEGYHAKHVFQFDYKHLNRSNAGILVLPAGKSGHLELGYLRGQGKPTYVLFDSIPDRFDLMYQFQEQVFFSVDEMCEYFKGKPDLLGLRQSILEADRQISMDSDIQPYKNVSPIQPGSWSSYQVREVTHMEKP